MDGGAVLEELLEMEPVSEEVGRVGVASRPAVLQGGQTLYSVVLAVPAADALSTDDGEETSSDIIVADLALRRELEAKLVQHGLRPIWLLDGSLLLAMPPTESASDQAARAARCALLIKAHWPIAAVALGTGRGHMVGQGLIGEVVDRAASLLRHRGALGRELPPDAATGPGRSPGVWVDPLSASLLERRFILVPVAGGALLTGEPLPSEAARPILGRITPCVGREPELAILEAILARCRSDSEAQATLVLGAAGLGKTRLRQEFLQRILKQTSPATVLLGVGESFSAGAPYTILGQALRGLCAIAPSEDAARGRARLVTFCKNLLGDKAGARAAPFLAELCALPFADETSPELRSSRGDSRTMAAQLLLTFVEVLQALCARTPVLLVLDDLHFGDALTIQLVDGALRQLESQPFMVLGLCRPDVKTHLPGVRKWPCVKEIPLEGLSRLASERLVRLLCGDTVASDAVSRLIQNAAGNALLLEELIRAEGEPHGEALPATVLAILQARMQRLDPQLRLLLGKASLFGQRFCRAGLLAILDAAQVRVALEPLLDSLLSAELIVVQKPSVLAGEIEYGFRHPLMREAAYGLLHDEQKRIWHRIAAEFLEQRDEPDATGLAEHFSRSDEPARAAPYFARLATLALDGNNLQVARSYVDRGLAIAPQDETRGALLGLKSAILHRTRGLAESLQTGEAALRLLPPGGMRWCRTFHSMLVAAMFSGDRVTVPALAERFLAILPNRDALAAYLESGGMLLSVFCLAGQRPAVAALLSRLESQIESRASGILDKEPAARMWLRLGQSRRWRFLDGDPWCAFTLAEAAVAAATQSGNRRWLGLMQSDAALAELELGSPNAEDKLRAAVVTLRGFEDEMASDYATLAAAYGLSERSENHHELAALVQPIGARSNGNALFLGFGNLVLSRIHAAAGAFADAETDARAALAALSTMPPLRCGVFAQLGRVLLTAGRIDEARAAVEQGLAELRTRGDTGHHDLRLRLCAIEVRRAQGDLDGADAELRVALSTLKARAERIPSAPWRSYYLENIVENAQLLALERSAAS